MTFDDLLDSRAIERVTVTPEEAAELIRLARRDIATAQTLTGTDLDWAFAIAYNALLQSSVAYMASLGYRSRSRDKHFVTFRFIREALPDEPELNRKVGSRTGSVPLPEGYRLQVGVDEREVASHEARHRENDEEHDRALLAQQLHEALDLRHLPDGFRLEDADDDHECAVGEQEDGEQQ